MKRFKRIAFFRPPKHTPLILGVALVLLVLLVFWFDSVRLSYVTGDFSYTADLNSTDNFYDASKQRYAGGRNSFTRFTMEPVSRDDDGIVSIVGTVETIAQDGTPVSAISRTYGIDESSGKHVRDQGSVINKGHLLAPRGLDKGESFEYQHVTYDAPAIMDYKAEEQIFDLPVYRYETRYADANRIEVEAADGTATAAPSGLEYDPHLTMWIEPTTGWLVKYEEGTTVYSYDRNTGQRGAPVSQFSSVFTDSSVRQHAAYARDLKYRLSFGQQTVPAILVITLLIAALWVFARRMKINSLPIGLTTGFVLLVSAASFFGWAFGVQPLLSLPAGGTGTNPMVSICFILAALCIQFIYRKKLTILGIIFSGIIISVAILGIARGAMLVGFDVDTLLFTQQILNAPEGMYGRMSLFEAFLLLLLGAGLLKNFLPDKVAPFYFARLAAGLVVVLGAVGLVAKLLLLDDIFAVSFIASLSVGTAILFIVLGAALLQVRLHYHDRFSDLRALGHALVRSVLLAIPLVIIGVLAQVQQNAVKYQLQSVFNAQVNTVQTAITSQIDTYADVLTGEKALFAASQEVEASEWQAYVAALDLENNYPGVAENGFVRLVSKNALPGFLQQAKKDNPNFTVLPPGEREMYAPTLFLTAPNGTLAPMPGFDMFSEATRNETMDRARDSGSPNLSGKLTLLHSGDPGFTMFLPVYQKGSPVDTIEQRRAALQGFVYLTFTTASLLEDVSTVIGGNDVVIQIYDGLRADHDYVVYGQEPRPDFSARLERTETEYFANHPWTINYKARPSLALTSLEERMPTYILFGGSIIYLVILVFILWGRNLRKRLREEKRANVQSKQPRS